MALELYKLSGGYAKFSRDLSYSNPILWAASSQGGVLEAKYFLRMENSNEYCTAGKIFAVDTAGEDESSWFSFAPDEAGGPGSYQDSMEFEIPLGGEVPVWIRVSLPDGIEQEPKDDIKVTATYLLHIEDEEEDG